MTRTERMALMQSLVNQWKKSGISQAKFAANQDLTLVKLHYLVHKLKVSLRA